VTTQELEQVKDLVLRDLSRVLEQDPKFIILIEGLLSERFQTTLMTSRTR